MKAIPGKVDVVDMQTGEVTESRGMEWQLLPPAATACQVCARDPAHPVSQPHDAQSLYYKYAFYADHGRWPTWKDAVAHCEPAVRAAWEEALRAKGAWTE